MLHARLLRYLDEVERSGSIRKAATRLNVASSAINRQILALEEAIGEPVFERLPRGLRLTAAGELVIAHIRRTLSDYGRTRAQLSELRGIEQGNVTMAATPGLVGGALADFAAEFGHDHPRVRVRLVTRFADGIAAAVAAGECDLGATFEETLPAGVRRIAAFPVPLGLLVSAEHDLAGAGRVRLAQVADYPLVLAEPGMNLRRIVDGALARLSLTPAQVTESNSVIFMKRFLTTRPDAVAFLNPLDADTEIARGTLVHLPLDEPWLVPQSLKLVERSTGALEAASSRFAEKLRHRLGSLAAEMAPGA